ncbi:hypothetical protein BH09ACT10_BH09ACT10_17150 [soil metagenome]
MTPTWGTWLLRGALVVVGLYTSLLTLVLHRQVGSIGGVDLPWGLVVALGTLYVIALAGRELDGQGVAIIALTWFVVVVGTMAKGGEGYLLATDGLGLVYCLGAVALLCFLLFRFSPKR